MRDEHKAKKMPLYCRPHGNRIIIFLNGIGGCRRCCDKLTKELQDRATVVDLPTISITNTRISN